MGFDGLIELFKQTQSTMQAQAARSVDVALVVRNWLFGWYIVEFENGGAERAELYGKELIKQLSEKLSKRLGKGFSKRSLEQFRRFYMNYKEIAQTLSAQSSASDKQIQQMLTVGSRISEPLSGKLLKSPNVDLDIQKIWQALSAKFNLSWTLLEKVSLFKRLLCIDDIVYTCPQMTNMEQS